MIRQKLIMFCWFSKFGKGGSRKTLRTSAKKCFKIYKLKYLHKKNKRLNVVDNSRGVYRIFGKKGRGGVDYLK